MEFSWALQVSGDYAPTSSVPVPAGQVGATSSGSTAQHSILATGAAGLGVVKPGVIRVLAQGRFSYGWAGPEFGFGDAGLFAGGGLWISFPVIPSIKGLGPLEPFVRATYDVQVSQWADKPTATFARSLWGVSAGLIAWRGQFGLQVGYGGDVAGGTSFTVGLTFGLGR
jgi:hypothetical protein